MNEAYRAQVRLMLDLLPLGQLLGMPAP